MTKDPDAIFGFKGEIRPDPLGIEIPMSVELEVFANAKAEVILGGSGSFVGGEELNAVLGLAQSIHAVNLFDVMLGESIGICLGHALELTLSRHSAQAFGSKVSAQNTDCAALQNNIKALANEVSANRCNIAASENDVKALKQDIAAEASDIRAFATDCLAEKMELVASNTKALASSVKAVASAVNTMASNVKLAGDDVALNGIQTSLGTADTELTGLKTIV